MRQDINLPPQCEAVRLTLTAAVAMVIPMQVLGPVAPPAPNNVQVIAPLSQAGLATAVKLGAAAQVIAPLSQMVTMAEATGGSANQVIAPMAQIAIAAAVAAGSADQVAGGCSQSAIASAVAQGVADQAVSPLSQAVTGKPYRLWTPANLTTAPLVVVDPATFTWSGSNFIGGTNPGSIGGSFAVHDGAPARATADANGHDALSLDGSSSIYLPNATTPDGNLVVLAVTKKTGITATGLGPIMAQSSNIPGWVVYDQIDTPSDAEGTTLNVGDVVFLRWPATGVTFDAMVQAHPPADGVGFKISVAKAGTDSWWRTDGSLLTAISSATSSMPGATTDLTIGFSYSSNYYSGNIACEYLLQDPSLDEIEKLEGWAAYTYGTDLAGGHPYKTTPPTVF